MEKLAELEHSRWCAYMYINGWHLGEQRDEAKKVHTDLESYDRLSDSVKQYDRDTVKNIPVLLKQLGLEACKA